MRSDPFEGDVKIADDSSLRKLARAMRRGMVPNERQAIIKMALKNAAERSAAYLNSSPAKRAYVSKRDAAG